MIQAIGKVGQEILKHLYTGKKWVGAQSVKAAGFAATKGHPHVSKAITGVSQKGNLAIKWSAKKAKEYPKIASAVAGAATIKFLDD
jgi:MOSC domain-containing protein YiiM